ncbi:MAG TPA: amidase [Woeseiaceae bacterium]|nr:amidase [Woeseiaceae bacterium]
MNRRDFLGRSSGLGMALTMPPFAALRASELPADITDMSASTLSIAIRQRAVSCREVMQAYLDRIDRYNPVYNAIVSRLDTAQLLRAAESADRELDEGRYRGWLHGMPHAVKDLADVKGIPSSYGSPLFAGTMPDEDTLAIARIRAAGAIFIGKTNAPEFGYGSQTYNPVFGATGSAYDPALTAGGSSGGAACGLGTHMLPIADGSDMMGSLRNPGAFNNVIGFRPTQGRVPDPSGELYYQQLSTDGPLGRNTEDAYRLLCTMAGSHPRAPLSLRDPLPPAAAFTPLPLRGVTIGWLGDYAGYLATEPGVLALCEQGLESLADNGSVVEPCRPDYDMHRLWETWLTLRHWSANWARELYDAPATRAQLKPELAWEVQGSIGMTAARVYAAGQARSAWFRAIGDLFARYDFLALPTAQVFPFPKDVHWPQAIAGRKMDTYHRWMEVVIGGTLAGIPVVNVPVGFDARGRPMGMQLLAPFGDDQRLLQLALAYEQVTDFLDRRPVPGAV